MTETPREYKKRIDETRAQRRKNRDQLLQELENYELIDEKYKSKTKQEILSNFEKNEKAEKNSELYIKIGEELEGLDVKYQELKKLKEELGTQIYFSSNFKKQLMNQDMDGADETTLKMQMLNLKKIKAKLDASEEKIKELGKEIENREQELKEIEETYGKKVDTDISDSTESNTDENISKDNKDLSTTKTTKAKTLEEYKERTLENKLRTNQTRHEIIKLLDKGIGIDDTLKEKIKGEITEVFEEYNDEIEGSLRMKSAKYIEDRETILNLDTTYRIKDINGKKCFMRGNEQYSELFDDIPLNSLRIIGGKPCYNAKKDWKWCIMRGKEQYSDWFDDVGYPEEIEGKPCYNAKKDGKWCIMRGNEQIGDWYDNYKTPKEIKKFIKKYKGLEELSETTREKREKTILQRYQKKLNRDELLKIISGCKTMDDETKKRLESEILRDFYDEFKKVTSTPEHQERDKKYRELKKTERQKAQKTAELESQREKLKPEVAKLDEKLSKIANSAMKIEDDSRFQIIKGKKLEKAKEERGTLENKLNEILGKVMKLSKEEIELISKYTENEKSYGEKSTRPRIEGELLIKDSDTTEKLDSESTFLGHKKAYMELIKEKEKYIEEILKQIEGMDFGISEEKKKEVFEIVKITLEKDLAVFKEGDEITKLSDETEKWLKKNRKTTLKKIDNLKGKIQEKEKEIEELKLKLKGDSTDEIFQIKEKEFELRNELLSIKNEYESIKNDLDEKLEKYNGTSIDWEKQIQIETRNEKLKREEKEEIEKQERTKEELKEYRDAWEQKINLNDETKAKIIKAAEKIRIKIEKDNDGSRLISLVLGNKKYQILDPILNKNTSLDENYSHSVDTIKEAITRVKRRQVYQYGMQGKDVDKWENEPLKKYVKQKMDEGLNIASMDDIKKLLIILKNIAGLEDEASGFAMLMYLTGLNGGYWLVEGTETGRWSVRFRSSPDFEYVGNNWRLNLLMLKVSYA